MVKPILSLLLLSSALTVSTVPGAASAAGPVDSTPGLEILVSDAGEVEADGAVRVDLRLLNGRDEALAVALPDHIEGRIELEGRARSVWLKRAPGTAASVSIAPGGFARARYLLVPPAGQPIDGAGLSIVGWNVRNTMIALRPPSPPLPASAVAPVGARAVEPRVAASSPSDGRAGNAFLGNLSIYEPIYAVYGPGTDAEARIQLSFKYQLFGRHRGDGDRPSWLGGFHLAYTQRMFWDLNSDSSPFRNIDYQPELIWLSPSATLANGIMLSAQGGFRHESNGRDGAASRSLNSFYVAPMAAIPLGDGYRLSLAPRLSFLVGDLSDNPDIRRYRGHGGLFVQIGHDEGLRLSTSGRLNVRSGKGAIDAGLSYPLPRLLGGGPDFYLFAQGFAGYGENLLDYDRRMTRLRLGVALVR